MKLGSSAESMATSALSVRLVVHISPKDTTIIEGPSFQKQFFPIDSFFKANHLWERKKMPSNNLSENLGFHSSDLLEMGGANVIQWL